MTQPAVGTVALPTARARAAFEERGYERIGTTDDGLDIWLHPEPRLPWPEAVLASLDFGGRIPWGWLGWVRWWR